MYLENDTKWLFKYMPFKLNAVKLITNNELWFAKPDTQNDPNEAEFILNYTEKIDGGFNFRISIQEELDTLATETDCGKKSTAVFEVMKFEKELKKVVRDYLGICSMSVKYDDILMWAHYADNNEGICVVFDKEILTKSLGMESGKVTYSSTISNSNFIRSGNLGQLISDRLFYMDKLVNWKDEEEFRFIKRFNYRIPQNDLNRLKPFPANALVGVILGEKFQKENFKTLINLAFLRDPKKEFHFWKCSKNLYKNSMGINHISDEYVNNYSSQNDYPFEYILKWSKAELK